MDAVHPKNPLQPADQRPPRDAPRGHRGIPTHSEAPTPATRRQPTTGPPNTRANSPPPTVETIHPSNTPPLTNRRHRTGATTRPRSRDPPTRGPREHKTRTTWPTQRWADTPKHHTTTPPWLRQSSPAHPVPGDPRPHATPTPHSPRTETRQEDDQETTRGCPTPPEDKPRATIHPTRPRHGAPPPPTGRAPHSTTPPYRTAPPSPTRGHGTPQPTNTGTKPRPADSAPHPTNTTPGNPAHLAPAQHPPPATTRTAHRGNTTGQDSHQRAATHHNHAKRRASSGAQPRTGRRTCPEHQHHTPTVP